MKRKWLIAAGMLLSFALTTHAQDKNFHIYLCIGQSNMVGAAKVQPADSVVDVRFLSLNAVNDQDRTMGTWRKAVPPLCRRYAGIGPTDFFGRQMVKVLPEKVRVGVVHVAVNGCASDLFHKNLYQDYVKNVTADWMKKEIEYYNGNPRQRLLDMARQAQKEGVIKGILYHQGETDAWNEGWLDKMKFIYQDILSELHLDAKQVPLLVGEVVGNDQHGVCAGANKMIDRIQEVIPTAHVISSYGCQVGPDNLHFAHEGYEELGKRYALKMLSLEGYQVDASAASIATAKSEGASFKFTATLKGNKAIVTSDQPLKSLEVVSFSGHAVRQLTLKGEKKVEVNLKGLKEPVLVFVGTAVNGAKETYKIYMEKGKQ